MAAAFAILEAALTLNSLIGNLCLDNIVPCTSATITTTNTETDRTDTETDTMANNSDVMYTFKDEQCFRKIAYTWATAYDTKDWALLHSICAPEIRNYYGKLSPELQNKIVTVEEYVSNWSSQELLGDERVKTQHLLGAVNFEMQTPNAASGTWQICATHRRKLADGQVAVWIVNAYVTVFYDRVEGEEGEWKFGGVQPWVLCEEGKQADVLGTFPRGT